MATKLLLAKSIYNEENRVWSGRQIPSEYDANETIGQVILKALRRDPNHVGQICYHNGKEYTNGEIATLMVRVAQHLQKLNLKPGDIVGLCASNSDFIAPLFFGCLAAGLTVSTLDTSFDTDGIKHTFSMTNPKIMFCDGDVYEKVKEVFDECHLTQMIYTVKDHLRGVSKIDAFLKATNRENQFMVPSFDGDAHVAAILCSSGTTGLPKGVCLSHSSLLNRNILNIQPTDKLLCFSTLYWYSGLMFLLYGTLAGATRVIVDRKFYPELFFDTVRRYRINVVLTPPSQLGLCLMSPKLIESDLSSLETYILAGSAVPYALVEKFKKYALNAKFITGYGMTEVSGMLTLGEILQDKRVGQLTPNTEIKVVDDNNESLKPGELGEFCLRQPYPWAGYYNNPSATAATYDSDNWVRSGDLGFVDEHGEVFIVDRKKDVFKYNNFHIFPTEIESVINELPQVVEACVCGIPDIVFSHLPAAAVVKIPGSNLTENEIYEYVAEKMDHFKYLRGGVYFFNTLPKTVSGKNLRGKIAELCEQKRNEDCNNTLKIQV